jgi:hypothetical protein
MLTSFNHRDGRRHLVGQGTEQCPPFFIWWIETRHASTNLVESGAELLNATPPRSVGIAGADQCSLEPVEVANHLCIRPGQWHDSWVFHDDRDEEEKCGTDGHDGRKLKYADTYEQHPKRHHQEQE